jgi:coenzyme PQQ synthesis protein D (PqqD)
MGDGSSVVANLLDATARIPADVVFRDFMHETVVLNLKTGKYHGLNPTGGRMLRVLEKTPRLRDAAQILAEDYKQPVAQMEQDLCEFCSELEGRGLLALDVGDTG